MPEILKKMERLFKLAFFVVIAVYFLLPSTSHAAEKLKFATVLSSSIKPYDEALKGFYLSLDERGILYESHEFILDGSFDDADLILKLRELKPDIIHTIGTKSTELIKDYIKDIPIIFSMVLNPEASGLVQDMDTPGANISGASMDIPVAIQFEYVKKLLPKARTIGVIYSNDETGSIVADAGKVAAVLGMKLVAIEIDGPSALPSALKRVIAKVDFLWSVADSNVFTRETSREILLATLKHKIPFMGLSRGFVRAGALIAFDVDARDIGKSAAEVAAMVIAGRAPANIPVRIPEKVEIVMNENTIDLMGIDITDSIYASIDIIKP